MGYLPEALRNYLLRLGWSHGDDEIISTEQAIEWFDLDAVGRSRGALRLREAHQPQRPLSAGDRRCASSVALVAPRLDAAVMRSTPAGIARLARGMAGLKQRAKTLVELAESAAFYVRRGRWRSTRRRRALLDRRAARGSRRCCRR